MIDLSITIVNYNTKDLFKNCLNSIYKETRNITFEIITVDNVSSDGSIEMIGMEFPQVKLIENKKNLFFTKAHNQALKIAKGRYLMILNSDTVILDGAFDKMVKFMDKRSECGACGPKLLNHDMSLQRSSDRLPTFLYGLFEISLLNTIFPNNPVKKHRIYADWDRTTLREVDTVGGSCMLIRKEIIDQVGLLDENFVAYWEEIDWSYRISKAGWKIYYLPDVKIMHHGGASTKKLGRRKIEKIFYNSLLYYYRKHFGFFVFLLLKLFLILTTPLLLLKRLIFSKE